jgi:hypothetical protein
MCFLILGAGHGYLRATTQGPWWITTHHSCSLGGDLTIFSSEVTSAHEVIEKTAKAPELAPMEDLSSVVNFITPHIKHFYLEATNVDSSKTERYNRSINSVREMQMQEVSAGSKCCKQYLSRLGAHLSYNHLRPRISTIRHNTYPVCSRISTLPRTKSQS